jgi:membrane-associated HD superfamily phosphohydrolase
LLQQIQYPSVQQVYPSKSPFSPKDSFVSLDKAFKSKESYSDALTTQQVTKEALKRVMDVQGESIRGPMILQMIGNYGFSILFLGVANQSNWAPYIRFYMGFLYIMICFVVLQLTRISHSRNNEAVIQFYTSLVPFSFFIFISREAHLMAFFLWFVAFMLIYMQSGLPNLGRHMCIYTVVRKHTFSLFLANLVLFYLYFSLSCFAI